jgi:hypothetical protein
VTVLGAGDFPARVNDVWELERLLDDNRMPAEEVVRLRQRTSGAPW